MIDDFLPMNVSQDDQFFTTLYAQSIWGGLLEKAFAKRFGCYEHIIQGIPSEAVQMLTGAPFQKYEHKDLDEDTLWQLLSAQDKSDDFVMCGTETSPEAKRNEQGLSRGQAFTVLGTVKLSDGQRLVKLRNPWGTSEGFSGAFDQSLFMDDVEVEGVDIAHHKTSVFYIDVDSYRS